MIVKEDTNGKIQRGDCLPISAEHLRDVIERLTPPKYKSKITVARQDDCAVYVPPLPLSKLLRHLTKEDNLSGYEEIIISSTPEALSITVIKKEDFEEDLIKYAHHAGFSIFKSEEKLRMQIPCLAYDWSNLYAETRNILLTLLELTDI